MDQLRAMRVFAAVIEAGSFNGAATALRLSPAAVTRHIAELEDHLDARLINRTTRRLALTDIGEAYLEKARQILTHVDEAEALASSAGREPRGLVRVLVPPAFAVHQIAKHLPRFHARFPKVSLELTVPGAVQAVDESQDVTILMVDAPLQGEFIARRLARSEGILCAAPEYLLRREVPEHPRDLGSHVALLPAGASRPRELTFRRSAGAGGEPSEVFRVVPRPSALHTHHVDTHYAAALAGLGIAGLPSFVAEEALLEGALVRLLPEWTVFSVMLYAALPTRQHIPVRTRAFVDFLIETFGGEDRDPWLLAAGCETQLTEAPAVAAGATPALQNV
ncbi:MAG: LysR family transcriptional regulator [Methylibium sp.]|uniref:LysR family transcriptional regulator n=1 Tax=Methylibium sp. TaxID=2067992 RepID=UPI0017A2CF55|nr:LysR family transcriptional regulator [Methylibium sp.]MBA3596701.1 LysR family transcriptional regulator [Methylibium sp.]